MSLPIISIPAVNIPFDIPTLLHPALAHFAIAIPVLIVIAEIFNIFINGKGIKIMSSLFMFLLIAIFFGMYLTGKIDGKAAIDAGFSATGELKEHKLLGIYLFYASIFVFILKLISLGVNKTGFKIFYILVLIGFLAGVLHQGKEGGELVYKYGANVKAQSDGFDDDEDEDDKSTQQEQKAITTESKPAKVEAHEESKEEQKAKAPQTTEQKDANETQKKEDSSIQESKAEVKEEAKEAIQKATSEVKEEAKEAAQKAASTVKEEAKEIKQEVKEAVKEVTDLNSTEH